MNLRKNMYIAAAIIMAGSLVNQVYAGDAKTYQYQVNISGATLFANYFSSPAGTNDYIDVDGDGHKGFNINDYNTPDQLATAWNTPAGVLWPSFWCVQTRGVGSGTGLADLINFNRTVPTADANFFPLPNDKSYVNRLQFAASSGLNGNGNPANPGGSPVAMNNIDIAVMDVPTIWFVVNGSVSNAAWNKAPLTNGYGKMALKSWTATQGNTLKSLISTYGFSRTYNLNTTSPDANTIFDNQIAWVPIAFCANPGAGIANGNITQTQLQYLYTTGRMDSGENLVAATRDSGSGTRNAAMNSLAIDPSWGRGDNVGSKSKTTGIDNLGPTHQPTNLDGTGLVQNVLKSRRLAVGYLGLAGTAESDARNGLYEILNLKKTGATSFVRPSLSAVLYNGNINTGWQVGGNETMATIGDPNTANPSTPHMYNPYAALYVKNMTESIRAFITSNGNDPNINMPGDYMANNYMLAAALDTIPQDGAPSQFIANPVLNVNLQNHILANNTLNVPAYGVGAGKVPVRNTISGTYSDGTDGSLGYKDSSFSGSNYITANSTLSLRNKIMGDFKYDGKRDVNDIPKMMAAVKSPRNFESGNNNGGNGYVCPEIIGDFNGDGNFDANDIRYFADGLAMKNGKLNREAGFIAVDTDTPNYFDTTIATGKTYEAGDSRGDIAGKNSAAPMYGAAPGAGPIGADGKVDVKDVDYINYVLRGGIRAAARGQTLSANPDVRSNSWDWNDADVAPFMDLSCDMNGDLKIDSEDVDILVQDILGTEYGDVNFDGKVDFKDFAILAANYGTAGGWAKGDTNGDGFVDQSDLVLMTQNWLFGN